MDAGILTTVAQACRDEERLRFAYTAQNAERSSRHVEPHRLVALGHRWYLVAFDLTRNDWRSFRVDRLDNLRTTGMRFQQVSTGFDGGVITAIGAIPGEDGGAPSLIMAVVRYTSLLKITGETQLIMTLPE